MRQITQPPEGPLLSFLISAVTALLGTAAACPSSSSYAAYHVGLALEQQGLGRDALQVWEIFLGKPTVPRSTSGPCSIRFGSGSPNVRSTHAAGPRSQRDAGFLKCTIFRAQQRQLDFNSPSRLVPGIGTHHLKVRKLPRSGQNCSDCKTPKSVPFHVYVCSI